MHDFALKKEDRVLILGATGFIGRRLVRELAEKDIKLRQLARDPSSASGMVPHQVHLRQLSFVQLSLSELAVHRNASIPC